MQAQCKETGDHYTEEIDQEDGDLIALRYKEVSNKRASDSASCDNEELLHARFTILFASPEKILIRRLPIRAEVNESMVITSLHLSVSISIAALMMKMKSPNVRITAGSVNSFRSEPMKVLINPNKAATQK